MKLLPDTHLLLWASEGSPRLSGEAESLLNDPQNTVYFSVISLLEIAIKHARGRSDFVVPPRMFREELLLAGYFELNVNSAHVLAVADLPPIHGDPFDRLLAAQANVEGLLLLTSDAKLSRYPGSLRM